MAADDSIPDHERKLLMANPDGNARAPTMSASAADSWAAGGLPIGPRRGMAEVMAPMETCAKDAA